MTGLLPFFPEAAAAAVPMPVRPEAEPVVEAAAFGAALQQAMQAAQPTLPAEAPSAPLSMLDLLDRLGAELVDGAPTDADPAPDAAPILLAPEAPVPEGSAPARPAPAVAAPLPTSEDGLPVLQLDPAPREATSDAASPVHEETICEGDVEMDGCRSGEPAAAPMPPEAMPSAIVPVQVPAPVLTVAPTAPRESDTETAVPTTGTIVRKELPNGRMPRGAEISAERRAEIATLRARNPHVPSVGDPDLPADVPVPATQESGAAESGTTAADLPTLPAGVRVLELQTQPQRQPVTTRQPSAMAETARPVERELNTGAAMPAAAAEAIEQLRRPVAAAARPAREPMAAPAVPAPAAAPVLQAAERSLAGGSEQGEREFGSGTPLAEPTLRERAAQQQAPAMPAELLRTPTPVAVADAGAAEPIAAPAPVLEPQAAPTLGTERISVRLGSEEGAPVVRISIRGDQVNAKISTSDASLARELGSGVRELAAALESRGFESARVSVRGTASAQEVGGPAAIAASSTIGESRSSSDAKNDDQQRRPDEQGRQWREERYDAREQQRRRPRVVRYDDDHEG